MEADIQHVTFKTLDNSPRVLFWNADEFLCVVLPVFLSICTGCLYFVPLGLLLKPIYTKLKRRMPRGMFHHLLYWNLPTGALKKAGLIKNMPPSHQREYLL